MNNLFYSADRTIRNGFNITLDSHLINLAISKFTIEPNLPDFGIEVRYINEILN